MTNTPLPDMTARAETCQAIIDSLTERTDGCDLLTVLSIIWDADDSGVPLDEWIKERGIAAEIIAATQSNYKRSFNAMVRAARLDDAIARYGDPDRDF